MNQDMQEAKNGGPIEDLTVNEERAAEVKGGAQVDFFLRLKGVDGEA